MFFCIYLLYRKLFLFNFLVVKKENIYIEVMLLLSSKMKLDELVKKEELQQRKENPLYEKTLKKLYQDYHAQE